MLPIIWLENKDRNFMSVNRRYLELVTDPAHPSISRTALNDW